MQMIELEDNNEAEISCPMCGTKNIQTKGLETAIVTECEHLESITSNLVWGEMEIDKNKILQKAFEKHDRDGNLEIDEFFNILKSELGNDYVLFRMYNPPPDGSEGYILYRF